MTPHQKWNEGIQSSGFPFVPPPSPAMDRLFLRMDPQTRQVRGKGIPAFGLHYWSTELGGIERIDRTGRGIEYNFRSLFDMNLGNVGLINLRFHS